jgi:hypothetical protein
MRTTKPTDSEQFSVTLAELCDACGHSDDQLTQFLNEDEIGLDWGERRAVTPTTASKVFAATKAARQSYEYEQHYREWQQERTRRLERQLQEAWMTAGTRAQEKATIRYADSEAGGVRGLVSAISGAASKGDLSRERAKARADVLKRFEVEDPDMSFDQYVAMRRQSVRDAAEAVAA